MTQIILTEDTDKHQMMKIEEAKKALEYYEKNHGYGAYENDGAIK